MNYKSKVSVVKNEYKKKAISLTTYRALFIAKLLSIKDMDYDEINNAMVKDSLLSNSCHKDTILNSINSLRSVGFEIERPKPLNNYKFKLLSHPFKFKITKEQSEVLNLIRNSLYYQNDYKLIFDVNDIYNKILKLSYNEEFIDIIESSNYFNTINKNILESCLKLCQEQANANILYNSPINGKERLKIKAHKIVFENNRLYLWLHSYKYDAPSYLRIDKILEIENDSENVNQNKTVKMTNFVEYELHGNAARNFIPKTEEIIVFSDSNKIVVKSNVINKFNFFQRIISFADECKILAPDDIKQEFVEHINSIVGVYNDAE